MMNKTKIQGIALIQVLLIVGILSVLVLYLSQSAKEQVYLSQMARDRAVATAKIHDAKNLALYELLTDDRSVKSQQQQGISDKWNFYGEEFDLSPDVQMSIQDQAGLLSLHYLDCSKLIPILQANGIDFNESIYVCDAILDWQDANETTKDGSFENGQYGLTLRNSLIPDLTELKKVPLVTPKIYALLPSVLTLHDAGWFNPMSSPREVLSGIISEDRVNNIVQTRKQNRLSNSQFSNESGIQQSEEYWLRTSNILRIVVTSQVGDVNLSRQWVFAVSPYSRGSYPVSILESRG